ncbi:MAG: transposase [Owenweeksia sp.]|nr:transposase [Owenweeksia sp.]
MTATGKWKPAKNKGKWLFPVKDKGMSQAFRAKYMALLRQWAKSKEVSIDRSVFKKCFDHNWVVFAKDAFRGPKGVMEYLGRYSHKIAISNHRLVSIGEGKVAFKWKDYRTLKNGVMELDAMEFLRRFSLHILPKGFPRIRHYGFLASRHKAERLELARKAIGVPPQPKAEKQSWQQLAKERLGFDAAKCPACGGKMEPLGEFLPGRPPPLLYLSKSTPA